MFITLNRVVLAGHSYATVLFSYRLGGQYTRARCVHSYLRLADSKNEEAKWRPGGRSPARLGLRRRRPGPESHFGSRSLRHGLQAQLDSRASSQL